MPRYYIKNDTFIVTMITGPSHVYLGLEFGELNHINVPTVTFRESDQGPEQNSLDEQKILQSVLEGITAANDKYGVTMTVSKIECIANDTPQYDLYQHCAFLIVEGIATNQNFIQT